MQRPLRHPPARPRAASAFASAFSDQPHSHEGLRRWLEQPVTHTGHVPVTAAACDAHHLIPASENVRMTTIIAPRVHDIGASKSVEPSPPCRRAASARSCSSTRWARHSCTPAPPSTCARIHIGLATVTYLWSGAIGHRDTGSDQVIRPGDVNWMTAGRGIAHSERTPQRTAPTTTRSMACRPGWRCRSRMRIEPAYHHAAATLPSSAAMVPGCG